MAALTDPLRSNFEKAVVKARDAAEKAARAALTTLAVENDRPFEAMSEEQRDLRRSLRARARQLGEGDMTAGMPLLVEEIAYEQWHRMLFARFLAENELLMHPEGVAVTLEECAELAQEEGAEDLWAVATRYAGGMLPGIFRVDDPALQVRFAPEGRHKLEQIVSELPRTVFTSDDGLGWAYQFWQSKKKDEVNASERKIGGADIAPVTQLFTEDYMVKFLLHNTLGAWWAHRHPDSPLNETFDYLRYRDDGTPAAGTFDGWPEKVAEVTMMDPCGGSGHFVVSAFEMFTRMRMETEGLSAAEAGDAVIRDNVHMLEIDLRCTQIAAFNLVLAAWKNGGYRELPTPNIACSGIPVQGQLEEWTKLAGENEGLKWALERLHHEFRHAPELGSLIDPTRITPEERLFLSDYGQITELISKVLIEDNRNRDSSVSFSGFAASDVSKAAELLARQYVFVVTNVPFLGQNKQNSVISNFCVSNYPAAKRDLATVFIQRIPALVEEGGSYAIVSPQNWLFLGSYEDMRKELLTELTWLLIVRLGAHAFQTPMYDFNICMLIHTNKGFALQHEITNIDVQKPGNTIEKAREIQSAPLTFVRQQKQFGNPDTRIVDEQLDVDLANLLLYADSHRGIGTGDTARWIRWFWEVETLSTDWDYVLGTFSPTKDYNGRQQIIYWQQDLGDLHELAESLKHLNHAVQNYRRGQEAWGRPGVAISEMGGLHATIYRGEKFLNGVAVITPNKVENLGAIWSFCSSEAFSYSVRKIDQKLWVTSSTLLKVPFDVSYWQQIANELGPIQEPYSNDSTQWLFKGDPAQSSEPLQVSVARLVGYEWPEQEADDLNTLADEDGIVCQTSVVGEVPAAERLRTFLGSAYGVEWSLAMQRKLLEDAGFKGKGLDVWLRDSFFKQHCKLFKNRPFIWHIWDGRKDGFSALVNYHKLDHARLERLIYTYLGDWINTQRAEQEQGVAGADGRLVAALELMKKLELILEGEPPYDIYVRWKPLHEQPIGWNPDLNDGVRLNIRPFVRAGVLRSKFTVHWRKDRGKNPDGSERINDLHFTREEKLRAREEALGTI